MKTTEELIAQASVSLQELPILVGENRHAIIPFPMTEDDFDLLIGTLNLWKKKIVRSAPPLESPICHGCRAEEIAMST